MKDWQNWLTVIQNEFRNNPKNFLRKPNIKRTVHPENGGKNMLSVVQDHEYFNLIADPAVGSPKLIFKKTHSKTAVQSLYHITRMQKHLGFNPKDLSLVTDIGAGYGHMSYSFRKCGFKGIYNCIDFDVMHEMQKHFLEKSEVPTANFLSLDQLGDIDKKEKSLIFGSYSINEMPSDSRSKIEPVYSSYKYIMIVYKANNEFGVDNVKYFEKLKNDLSATHNMKIIDDPLSKNDFYLIGKKK